MMGTKDQEGSDGNERTMRSSGDRGTRREVVGTGGPGGE